MRGGAKAQFLPFALQVEAQRLRMPCRIKVGRSQQQQHALPRPQAMTGDVGVGRQIAARVVDGGIQALAFRDAVIQPCRLLPQRFTQAGIRGQPVQHIADQPGTGIPCL
ncbi:hypothetical protein D3C85_1608910 [compost metagenome]